MPTDFAQEAGGVLAALPLERMFQAPANAMAATQVALSRQYYDFVRDVGLTPEVKDAQGNVITPSGVRMVEATFDEPVLDSEGNLLRTVQRKIAVPLLSILTHPNVNVTEGSIEFELTIQSTSESSSTTEGEGSGKASIGWGPFKMEVSARASHKSSQTRKTDTRARYAVSMKIVKDDMPEGMAVFMETIRNASMQTIKLPEKKA